MDRTNDGLAIGVGVLGTLVVAGLLAPFRADIDNPNVALLLALVVIGAASLGGRRAGMVTGAVAALSFNYLHTMPYMSLRIDGAQDVVTFLLLIVVGVVSGQLAHISARRGREARQRAMGIEGLHELSQLASRRASAEVLVDRSEAYLVAELGLNSCRFVRGDALAPPDLDHRGVIDGPLRHGPGGFELPEGGVSLPVFDSTGAVHGRFVLLPSRGRGVSLVDRKLAVLVADVVGPALSHSDIP